MIHLPQEKFAADLIELQQHLRENALRSQLDRRKSINGTSKVIGYVCNIHTDDEEDPLLRGTVDVQEYAYDAIDFNGEEPGFHQGVLLSAIEGNKGYKIVPCMYSEVIIQQDPSSLQWYVTMYSHASIIDLKVHDEVNIEAIEYEDFEETENGLKKDYFELEETGNKASTHYTPTSIVDQVVSPDDKEGYKEERTAERKTITIGSTKIVIDGNNVSIETDKEITVKASTVNVTGGKLNVKGQSSTDLQGPFNAIKVCPFSGAPHCGSMVSGT